jgi:regulator of RNase E activity RraA
LQPDESGFEINLLEICERYHALYAGLVFDVLEHLGYPNQAVSHEITGLTPTTTLIGPAFTVKGTISCEGNETARYKRLNMIKEMRSPCVEVRDRGTPFNVSVYGELSANSARAFGAVGALIDGGVRDCSKLISMDYPVFCRFRSPVEAFGRWALLDYQVPIILSGELSETVRVDPGDFIFGDFDGVLVIPKHLTLHVLEESERVMGIENLAREEFARGDDPVEVFERHKRL